MNHSVPKALRERPRRAWRGRRFGRRSGWRGPASASRLASTNVGDVDGVGDDRLGRAEVGVLVDLRAARASSQAVEQLGRARSMLRRMASRFIVASKTCSSAGQLGGPAPDPVDLDVVGVAVAAVVVVDGEHVGVAPRGGSRPAARPPRRRRPARSTPGCRWWARPSSRSPRSRGTRPARRRGSRPTRCVSAPGARHSGSPSRARPGTGSPCSPRVATTSTTRWPAARGLGHRAAGGDGLVVGMGVEADERGHRGQATGGPPVPAAQAMAPGSRSLAMAVGVDAPVGQDLVGVLAGVRRRPLDLGRRAAEPRRRRRLHDAVALDEGARGSTLCGCCGASPSDSTGAKQTSVPSMISHHSSRVLVLKSVGEPLLQRGPLRLGPCWLRQRRRRRSRPVRREQLGVELRLDRADRDVLAVGASRRRRRSGRRCRAGWCPARRSQMPMALNAVEHRHEHGGAVDHRRVDHLALARRAAPRAAPHTTPKASSMPPPPKSPTRLSGGTGASPARPMRLERAGERDVVDVVAGGLGVRARPGPSRSCGRRRAGGCGPGRRRDRGRAARPRRAGSPR